MDYVKPDPLPDQSKIKEHNDKYLESLNSGFGGAGGGMGPPTPMGMGPPTPMAMGPPTPMGMDLVSTHCFFTFLNHRKRSHSNGYGTTHSNGNATHSNVNGSSEYTLLFKIFEP